jgi:predicted DsbA family dithiol-disulfide isomerase
MGLVVFTDYACPFCYLAEAVLERVRAEVDVAVEYRAFELYPSPLPLADPDDEAMARLWAGFVEPLAKALRVPVRRPARAVRTRKAHEAAYFAREHGRMPELHRSIFRAHFVDGRDIGRVDVLVGLGEDTGLDRTGLKVALDVDRFAGRVADDDAAARRHGVTGVPAFLVGGEVVEGLQPPGALLALLRGTDPGSVQD